MGIGRVLSEGQEKEMLELERLGYIHYDGTIMMEPLVVVPRVFCGV